jgi:hypothetical protein
LPKIKRYYLPELNKCLKIDKKIKVWMFNVPISQKKSIDFKIYNPKKVIINSLVEKYELEDTNNILYRLLSFMKKRGIKSVICPCCESKMIYKRELIKKIEKNGKEIMLIEYPKLKPKMCSYKV